ncbi:MAG: hypothetical protein GY947_07170 [Rhodobacteraceae bacterium]|nr:hypothetical protein [Paracoccaceae bacterium]
MTEDTRNKRAVRDWRIGVTLKISGSILILASLAWFFVAISGVLRARDFAQLLLLNWHLAGFAAGFFLRYRGRQYCSRARPAEILNDTRPPVLFLRPFRSDASAAGQSLAGLLNPGFAFAMAFTTDEEQLAEVINPIGPMVALAQPRKALPRPGAARYHVSDDEWQGLVEDLMQKARLVVLSPGRGASIQWEIEKAFEALPPTRILLRVGGMRRNEYRSLADLLQQKFSVTLPERNFRTAFVMFSEDWKAQLVPSRFTLLRQTLVKGRKVVYNQTLRPVFGALGVPWKPSPISFFGVFAVTVFFILLVGVLLLLAIAL